MATKCYRPCLTFNIIFYFFSSYYSSDNNDNAAIEISSTRTPFLIPRTILYLMFVSICKWEKVFLLLLFCYPVAKIRIWLSLNIIINLIRRRSLNNNNNRNFLKHSSFFSNFNFGPSIFHLQIIEWKKILFLISMNELKKSDEGVHTHTHKLNWI